MKWTKPLFSYIRHIQNISSVIFLLRLHHITLNSVFFIQFPRTRVWCYHSYTEIRISCALKFWRCEDHLTCVFISLCGTLVNHLYWLTMQYGFDFHIPLCVFETTLQPRFYVHLIINTTIWLLNFLSEIGNHRFHWVTGSKVVQAEKRNVCTGNH